MGDPRQVHINNKAKKANSYDAIVVGSGISGGWAAKELCEKGLQTLLLERGRHVEHIKDYPTASMHPWELPHHLEISQQNKVENPVQTLAYDDEGSKGFYVNDQDHPYIQSSPFNWIRSYQTGGRSLVWGRQTYRLSDLDFEANAKDGHGVDWPIRYKDIAPWYDYVEQFVGISGQAENIPHLPDSVFLPPMEMTCVEKHFKDVLPRHFNERRLIHGRVANLTKGWNGRGPCQYRNLCERGCPFSGYFSSNAATLPAAMLTGNLTLVNHAIVTEVMYDASQKRATGVRVINETTGASTEYFARIIFLNASTIGTASLLLQSKSAEFPQGLGNSSGEVGHNLMDHHAYVGATGDYDGFADQYYKGRRPTGVYIPRFRNINKDTERADFLRGYAFQAAGRRQEWHGIMESDDSFGAAYKQKLLAPGPWYMWMGGYGECLPNHDNKISLSNTKKDRWGLPLVDISFSFGPNEAAMRKDMKASAVDMLEKTGFNNVSAFEFVYPGGTAVHEMGTARMGRDPKTSVLNEHNQLHDVKNVFVTDGSAMSSSACQNPSLTYMALTARACDFAVAELTRRNL